MEVIGAFLLSVCLRLCYGGGRGRRSTVFHSGHLPTFDVHHARSFENNGPAKARSGRRELPIGYNHAGSLTNLMQRGSRDGCKELHAQVERPTTAVCYNPIRTSEARYGLQARAAQGASDLGPDVFCTRSLFYPTTSVPMLLRTAQRPTMILSFNGGLTSSLSRRRKSWGRPRPSTPLISREPR